MFERVGGFIIRRWGLVTLGCVLVIGGCSLGLFRMQTSVHLIKFFDRHAKIIRDYTWLESHLAKLVPMELVVRVRPELMRATKPAGEAGEQADETPDPDAVSRERMQLDFLERMEIAARIQDAVARQLGEKGQGIVGQAMSAPTFAPELPPPGYPTLRDPVRSVMNRKLEEHRSEYLASDYLRIDRGTDKKAGGQGQEGSGEEDPNKGSELWRISLRVGALRDIDYGRFVDELKRVVEPVLTAYRYRDYVLSELDAKNEDRGFVKSRVAFLGLSDPAEGQPKAAEAGTNAATPESATGQPAAEEAAAKLDEKYRGPGQIDQTQLFAQTLKDLMTCAGVYAKAGCWHNPDKVPTESGFYSSDAWSKLLGQKFDCVVLVRDNPAYDVEFIKQHARIFIDARQHQFNPSSPEAETAARRGDPIHVVYTGVVPLVYKAQRSLLDSLIQSTFWSFITITPLMMFLARNVIAGLVVMLPNVLPVVVIFGGMGLLNIDVDVGSMMTASIALGVAVDDTIHFLTWYRQDFERLGDRNQAILAAYRRCALPTMQAAAISGLGLSVFALSTFTPTQRFGYLMLSILVCGVVAELIMLPALLAGPLGRFCNPAGRSKSGQGEGSRDEFHRRGNCGRRSIRSQRVRPAAHHRRRPSVARRRPAAARPRARYPRPVMRGSFGVRRLVAAFFFRTGICHHFPDSNHEHSLARQQPQSIARFPRNRAAGARPPPLSGTLVPGDRGPGLDRPAPVPQPGSGSGPGAGEPERDHVRLGICRRDGARRLVPGLQRLLAAASLERRGHFGLHFGCGDRLRASRTGQRQSGAAVRFPLAAPCRPTAGQAGRRYRGRRSANDHARRFSPVSRPAARRAI